MKISKLKIKNFKAFYGEYDFNFDIKNILIYGENGSGKSSLYWALYHIFYSFDKLDNVKKYKNIFAKDDLKIEVTFDNGNYVVFHEKDKTIINETIINKFKKLQQLKSFLSYNDIFLLNDLFTYNLSLDNFIKILENVYGEDIKKEIEKYKTTKKEFKDIYLNQKCELKEKFQDFRKIYQRGKFFDEFIEFQNQYEDIEKWDKEGDFIGYDTIYYYYSDEVISEYEVFLNNLKILNEELEFQCDILEDLIFELEDIKEYIDEKSRENNEERFSIDKEEIETIDILEVLKDNLNFVEDIVDSFKSYKGAVNNLNETISLKLERQLIDINEIIKNKFDLDLKIELKTKDFFIVNYNNLDKFFPIKYKITINKISPSYNHLKFLNEAKISSINFAFYLSIILSYAEIDELKILVLDDLLISLDMSNRDIILDMILEYFPDYQIIMLTHDKAFFEMAKQKFNYKSKNQWKYFEMYIDKNCETNIEYPFIKEYNSEYSYIDKAKEHFENKDYPACANYLRKEVERFFDKHLELDNLDKKIQLSKLKENKNLIVDISKDLQKLLKVLNQFEHCEKIPTNIQAEKCKNFAKQVIVSIQNFNEYINNKIYFEEFEDIKLILKNILHPQSHDDIIKPLYKKELEDAIEIVTKLKNIIEQKD